MTRKVVSFLLIPAVIIGIVVGCVLRPGFGMLVAGVLMLGALWFTIAVITYACPFWADAD